MLFILPVPATPTLATPQTAQAPSRIAPQTRLSLADTERAFARLALEQGVSPAFSAFFAAEGIVFTPRPTSAHARHDGKPDNGVRLAWEPAYAEVAASEDLGWTTGPFTWRLKPTDPAPPKHGHFVSIWRKQADGRWKVALDVGISHAEPPKTAFVQAAVQEGKPLPAGELDLVRRKMLDHEARFDAVSGTRGRAAALEAFAAEDLRTYREGLLPTRSRKAGQALVGFDEASTRSSVEGSGLSAAGDLGYTYGLASSRHARGAEPLPFSFVHIWRKVSGFWQLAVDIQIPAPDSPRP